jgi:mono/diheme cytochrome c family protein
MNRLVRLAGIGLGSIALLVAIAAAVVYGLSEMRLRKSYEIAIAALVVPGDAEVVERGRHLAATRGCMDCHTDDLGGQVFIDEPAMGLVSATNLTSGAGGVAGRYDDAAWERAIRHGVGSDGRALAIMPSKEYFHFGDDDVAALIAYLKSIPPVDRELPALKLGPVGRLLVVTGQLPLFPAEFIDHAAPRPSTPPQSESVEYGAYVATVCAGCHGPNFSGGKSPTGPPDSPIASNLTPHSSGLADWTEEDFVRALREGIRPDGRELDEYMPWRVTAQMTDSELRALWLYFQSLPPTELAAR